MSDFNSIIGSSRHCTVEELLDAFSHASATGNLREYFGCFYDERSRFLGTDASENWTAYDFFEYALPHFRGDGTPAWKYDLIPGTRKVDIFPSAAAPSFAIFDELLTGKFSTSRGSGTACYSSGHWFICAYHLTFPVPNDIAKDITKSIHKFEQEMSMRSAAVASDRHAEELLAQLQAEEESLFDKKAPNKSTGSKSKGKKKL
jgi:hypothetical protein